MNDKSANQKGGEPVITPAGPRPGDHVQMVQAGEALRRDDQGRMLIVPGNTASAVVVTPGGYRSRAQVHAVESGHYLDELGGRVRQLDPTGKVVADYGEIPRRTGGTPLMPGNAALRPPLEAGPAQAPAEAPALKSGWIAYADWSNSTGTPVSAFTTAWEVPPEPATKSGQLIYLFSGLQNATMIYQPVLQWGNNGAFGGDYWLVASWYADGQGGQAFYSPNVRVNPGDTLVGAMVLTGRTPTPTGTLFDYNCGFQGMPGTRLLVRNVEELTWAAETLEAYGLTKCSDYPATDRTVFYGISIKTDSADPALTWAPVNEATDCGQHATVGSDNNPGGQIDVFYRTLAVPPAPGQPGRIEKGEGVHPGAATRSPDGRFTLRLQPDGNLVLFGPQNQPLWESGTSGHPDLWYAIMQPAGNLVIYDKAARAIWATGTDGHPGAYTAVQNNGNLVVCDQDNHALWASNTVVPPEPAAVTQPGRLTSGQGLQPGQIARSSDGRFTLELVIDGNLVVRGPQSQPVWASNTAGIADAWDVIMQKDGNLVVYDVHHNALWAAGTNGHTGVYTALRNDGNLVVCDQDNHALWASNTVVPPEPAAVTQPGRLTSGQGLRSDESTTSPDGQFRLILSSDGNLGLYGGLESQLVWESNSTGHPDAWDAIMRPDGNFVVYGARGRVLWATGTGGHPGAWLAVQNDGNLVIYDAGNRPLWATNTVVPPLPAAPAQPDRLMMNEGLAVEKRLTSTDGRVILFLGLYGDLTLSGPQGQRLYSSGTGADVWAAMMRPDGNFVIYDVRGKVLWATGTSGHPGAWLAVQNDGNLVIYDAGNQPVWASDTVLPPPPAAATQPGRLMANEGLSPTQSVRSPDGRFTLAVPLDGNLNGSLVLIGLENQWVWTAGTAGHPGMWDAIMQPDGNFVIYDVRGKVLWATGTSGHPGAWLAVQNDGNLVIYDTATNPLWSAGSQVP